MRSLGLLYAEGQGVRRTTPKRASGTRRPLLRAMPRDAQTSAVYDNGRGVPQDYAKAREWYEKAAAAGERRR